MMAEEGFLSHALLSSVGVEHGFGTRNATEPEGIVRPRQVHGALVAIVKSVVPPEPFEADALATRNPGTGVGVITADCVPVLAVTAGGASVLAIHAGWRGLAEGVVEAGIVALEQLGGRKKEVRAVIGPCIGACCYEVDEPVLMALRRRFGDALDHVLTPSRPGHARLDLGQLVGTALRRSGLGDDQWGRLDGACTRCDPKRFHSYRRDGPRAGRLVHYIVARDFESKLRVSKKRAAQQG